MLSHRKTNSKGTVPLGYCISGLCLISSLDSFIYVYTYIYIRWEPHVQWVSETSSNHYIFKTKITLGGWGGDYMHIFNPPPLKRNSSTPLPLIFEFSNLAGFLKLVISLLNFVITMISMITLFNLFVTYLKLINIPKLVHRRVCREVKRAILPRALA